MILLVLGSGDAAIAASEISRKLTRRWGRAIPLAAVMLELQGLEQEGQVRRSDAGWVRNDEAEKQGARPRPRRRWRSAPDRRSSRVAFTTLP
jgi:repressor of nif and glnA expression